MAYYHASEMKQLLEQYPQFQDKLYCRGFLLTNQAQPDMSGYPFYGNWNHQSMTGGFALYTHRDTAAYTHTAGQRQFFLVGHAYDPFRMLTDEVEILQVLADALNESEDAFWEAESNLTGIFCLGYIEGERVVFTTDCAGMQLVYHGIVGKSLYLTSHSKLVADLCGLEQDPYVARLVSSRFYPYFGTWLPGDRSPFRELIRLQSNHAGIYEGGEIRLRRYYPTRGIRPVTSDTEYEQVIRDLSGIMSRSMELITRKWPDKKVAISVTGGHDSKTTFACANGSYDKFGYFSYISNDAEAVDAYAARDICGQLELPHTIYEIPREDSVYPDLEAFRKVMECNAGCIGSNNANDVRKRRYFSENCGFDIEIKSWVNEIGRARFYKRYNKKKFPTKLTAPYCRTLYKIIFSPWLIHETNKVFKDYLARYYCGDICKLIPWPDLLYWEFIWGSGEGLFLTAEHRVSYEITIPFNNRRYLENMLRAPLQKRIDDCVPQDIVAFRNPKLAQCGISVKDVGYTDLRTVLERGYLEIFSKLGF